jgi:uncharacterized protein
MTLSTLVILAALAASAPPSPPAPAREMTIGEGGSRLYGTYLAPASPAAGAEPVLILAGSGPTDRDGNNPLGVRAAPYRLLAEALAARGIPSLRPDKRGIAASAAAAPSESELRIQTFGDDARAWAARLRSETGARCVWLLGHSEGGLHALLAAQGNADVCGLILVSSPGRRLGDVLREQLNANRANAPVLPEALRILAELEAGRPVAGEIIHPALAPLFRPSVQPFMISLLALDPAALARRFEAPILVLQGTTDLQTAAADAQLLGAARSGITVRLIEGMNHVLKTAPAEPGANVATYSAPDLPLAPGIAEAVADFIIAN